MQLSMRINSIIGMLLIVLGLFALAYGGFQYTTREKVIDLGPLQATTESHKTIPLPPIVGGLALGAGALLLVTSAKKA